MLLDLGFCFRAGRAIYALAITANTCFIGAIIWWQAINAFYSNIKNIQIAEMHNDDKYFGGGDRVVLKGQ